MYPFIGSYSRTPSFPTPRLLPFLSSPAFYRYYGGAKTPAFPSAPTRLYLAARTRADDFVFTLHLIRSRQTGCGPGRWYPVSPYSGICSLENCGSPVFHGLPSSGLPCSSTPAAPRDLALFGPLVPPPSIRQRRPAARYYFRGSITRLSTSLSTLHAALSSDDARLAYGALATRFPAGLGPAWVTLRRFPPCSSFLASAF